VVNTGLELLFGLRNVRKKQRWHVTCRRVCGRPVRPAAQYPTSQAPAASGLSVQRAL